MRLKLSYGRSGEQPVDVVVTVDATASVADVARTLLVANPRDPRPVPGPVTLRVTDSARPDAASRTLLGSLTMADASLLSGAHVEVVADSDQYVTSESVNQPAVAQLRVLAGPDEGKEFMLPSGSTVIGRDRDADVRLTDPMVSKKHARLNISDVLEVVDMNSANGVLVGEEFVGRSVITPADTIQLGDTVLRLILLQSASRLGPPQVEHVRSPRVVVQFPGVEYPAPKPPQRIQPQRFPLLALVAPLLMGAVMWVMTQQLLSVVMMAMTPLLLVASFVDQAFVMRRARKAEATAFNESMLRAQERLEQLRDEERRVRLAEIPELKELVEDTYRLGPSLWSERAELPHFLTVRVGVGTLPSRSRVVLDGATDGLPESVDQVLTLRDEFSRITDVPVLVPLRQSGNLGVAGPAPLMADVARATVFQLAARHSPTELVVSAITSPDAAGDWGWLKWLPHTSSGHSPIEGPHLADGRGSAAHVLAQLEGVVDSRSDKPAALRKVIDPAKPGEDPDPVVPSVVVVVTDGAPADRARLTRIAEKGPDVGVHVVWCAPRVESLPAACRSYVAVDGVTGDGTTGQVRLGEITTPLRLDTLSAEQAGRAARGMAPVLDVGVPEEDQSDLPRTVSYAELAGEELLSSPDAVIERWKQNNSLVDRQAATPVALKKAPNLRALVGHAGTAPFSLDLRADGPHALVGGTTGAGKSEFLQSWVLGMAAAHSPDRLTFLFVDYKGGAAFADCVDLPHTVGLVTDLSPHLVRRALTSLRAELRYREHLLNAKGAKDLISLEKTGDPQCPPSLVIVVDEFAALVQEVPEFVDGVVDVAQRGRSLGLHLVLATQRPNGVIKDNLRANTNLRIALRMADEDDSSDVLGDKLAAYFDSSIPGRGAAKTGPGRIKVFQTGYVGGRTTGIKPPPRIEVRDLDFGNFTLWEDPTPQVQSSDDSLPTDITRMVANIGAAAVVAGVPEPRKPWLDELAPVYNFSKLPNPRTDEKIPLGVLDAPESQSQPTLYWEPDVEGNLGFFGTSGSGKSTALRTIAVAAAMTSRNGGPSHVYGLDFASRGLAMLDVLPHVGAVVDGDDDERVQRTIRMIRDLVNERAERYSRVQAGSIAEYRHIANAPNEPRVFLLVDNIGAFRERYEDSSATLRWWTAFAQIAADGRAVGVHVVVAGDQLRSLPMSIASNIQRRIILRQTSDQEYLNWGIPSDILTPASPPGRAVVDGNEAQLAILGESGNVAVQAREIQQLAASLGRNSVMRAAPVLRLPDQIPLENLPVGSPGGAVIGVADSTLEPIAIAPHGLFLLAGSAGSGRSTAVAVIAAAIKRADPVINTALISPRRNSAPWSGWTKRAAGSDAMELVRSLLEEVESKRRRWAIFIESIAEFNDTDAGEIQRLVKEAAAEDQFVLGEGEMPAWQQSYMLGPQFKAARRGLILVPGDMDTGTLFQVEVGRIRRQDFPPGRGFLVERGRASKLQLALVN